MLDAPHLCKMPWGDKWDEAALGLLAEEEKGAGSTTWGCLTSCV